MKSGVFAREANMQALRDSTEEHQFNGKLAA
jgi:hypothetical protein